MAGMAGKDGGIRGGYKEEDGGSQAAGRRKEGQQRRSKSDTRT